MNNLESSSVRGIAYAVLCLALIAVGFYLWTVHRQHLGGLVFYALALACPFMHLFMHRGHGHSHSNHGPRPDDGRRE